MIEKILKCPQIEIRKEFTFNNAHIVRNCSSERCKYSSHAHTYHVEVFLTSNKLDNGRMAVDFGLLKGTMKSLIKMFDRTYSLWNMENDNYRKFVYKNFKKVIEIPFSPSAEEYSIFFYKLLNNLLENTQFNNGEGKINISKVIVHETHSGYAIADKDSQLLDNNNIFNLNINFDCEGKQVIEKLKQANVKSFVNQTPEQQINTSNILF